MDALNNIKRVEIEYQLLCTHVKTQLDAYYDLKSNFKRFQRNLRHEALEAITKEHKIRIG